MKRYLAYGLLVLNVAIIVGFWYNGTGYTMIANGPANALIVVSRLCGLLAVLAILLQFTLIGRIRPVERLWGLDKMSRLHHWVGISALGLMLTHFALMLIGHNMFSKLGLWNQFTFFINNYEDVLKAAIALGLFILVVVASLTIVRRRLNYEYWHIVHYMVYVAILFAFGHQLEVGVDFITQPLFVMYWWALYLTVGLVYGIWRFLIPLYNFAKHQFVVEKVVVETPTSNSVYISGRNMQTFRISAGQFMLVRFLRKGMWWQAHPFSLSKYPDGKNLRVSIKSVGDFTEKISESRPGTRVLIEGPNGIFGSSVAVEDKVLLIAGGSGITPLRSLAERYVRAKTDVVMLYSNRNSSDVMLKRELDILAEHGLKLIYVMSDDKDWPGEKGMLDASSIKRLVPDYTERQVLLCGPPPMMKSLQAGLEKEGVTKEHIHFEKFSLQ